jgi:hypothetical protein
LLFILILVINYIILWEDNSLLKKLELAIEVESNNVRIVIDKVLCKADLSLSSCSTLVKVLQHKM